LGKGSIRTAGTYNNIGSVYSGQGKVDLALENYLKGLEIKEKIKGKDSIDAASTLFNIGLAYKKQGKHVEAA
jgi:tetratricopeptide (TPR) repeat protein